MENKEVQKQIAKIVDDRLKLYYEGINGMLDEENMIRISHEIIVLYRVLNQLRE